MKKCSSTAHSGMFRALCLLLAVVMLAGMFWAGTAVSASAEEPAAETQYGYKTVSQTGDYVHFDVSGIMPADAELKMDFAGQDYYNYILASLGKTALADNEFLYIYDLSITSRTVDSVNPADEYAVQFYLNEANISVDNMGVIPVASYNDFLASQAAKAAADAEKAQEELAAPADEAKAPAEDAAAPVEDAVAPVEDVAAPVEEVTAPVEDVAASVEEVAAPVEDVAAPAEPVAAPVEEVAAPVEAAVADAAPVDAAPAEDAAPEAAADTEAPVDAAEAPAEEASGTSSRDRAARAVSAVGYSADKSAAYFNTNGLGTFALYGTKFDRTAPVVEETPVVDNSLPAEAPAADATALADAYYQRLMAVQSVAEMVSILSEEEFANVKMTAEQLGDISFLLDALPEDEESYEDNYEAALTLLFTAAGEFTDDEPTTLAITGERTVAVGKSITLRSNNGYYSHSWSSSDPNVATVQEDGRTATVTGMSEGTVTITHTYSVWGQEQNETYTVTVTAPQPVENEGAIVYAMLTPDSNPDSNEITNWGTGIWQATINTTGATWTNEKNVFNKTDPLAKYIISWPDGSTDATWTVKDKTEYATLFSEVYENYKSMLESKYNITDLKPEDITEITLNPYKISKNNSTDPDKHIDCTIDIKCTKAYTAKFLVQEPGNAGNTIVYAETKSIINNVPDSINRYAYDLEKEFEGITYVFDGWYNEANEKVSGSSGWPYTPNENELADGTVYFYAYYTPKPASLTINKVFEGLGNNVTRPGITVTVSDGENYSKEVTLNSENNYTFMLENLDPRVEYTVIENVDTARIQNYELATSYSPNNGIITPSQTGENNVTITNIYTPTVTSLTVSKTVNGNFGDKAKNFDFTITVKKDDVDVPFKVNGEACNGVFQLADSGSIIFTDIPVGATVTVTEADGGDYAVTYSVNGAEQTTGTAAVWTAVVGEGNTIAFTNTKTVTPDTGINLDSLPYILVLAVVVAGAVVIIVRKHRRSYDD